MGTAIVVTSGKGGVGKSTVSLGLASQFAAGGDAFCFWIVTRACAVWTV